MNNDEFIKLLVVLEGVTRAILEVKDELKQMNTEGLVIFMGSDHLEN